MKRKNNQFYIEISKKTNQIMLAIFVLALIFVTVIGAKGNNSSYEPFVSDLSWNEGWTLSDNSLLSLPYADKTKDSITIRNTLPQGLSEFDSLVFSTGYQPLKVTVGGENVPVNGTFEGRYTFATAYNHISLDPDMSGKEVQVTLSNLGGKQWIEIYNIELGNFNLIRQSAFENDSVDVISAIVLMVFSFILFMLGLVQQESARHVLNDHTQNFLLSAILAFMFSVWLLVDTETVTLMFGHNPAYVFINIFAFLFIMGPWLMQIILLSGKHYKPFRILAMGGLIETAVIIIAALFGYFNFSAYLTVAHMLGACVEGSILYLSYKMFRQRRDRGSTLLFAAGVFLIAMTLVSVYVYYITISPDNIAYLRFGIFAYIVIMLYDIFATFNTINRRYVTEVEAARKAAVDASRAKSDFLSSMSHDIRTPMNAIMGLTTIASANIDNKDVVRDSLRKISLSSRHLLGLINDILDMSKIESGKISLTTDEISLSELMENLVNIIQPQIKSRRHKFDIFLENISSENVYCDGVRLNQILLNLLSNSVKFTREEGKILVTIRQDESPKGDKWVRTSFRVSDNGIGMSPEFLEQIFDSFTRADNIHVRATEGSGLGMSITKHIVDMMNGSITVDSRLGEGTTFLVTLDLERVTSEEKSIVLPPWNTLVVDDDKPLCLSAVDTLKDMGIKADWTLSGEQAVEMIDRRSRSLQPYHLVLLDWQMPGWDGIETARRIRECVGDDVPILLITAYDWSEIEEEAREAGINGFLAKPLFQSTLRYGLLHYLGENQVIVNPEHDETEDCSGKRILIAEDNDINWEIAQEILSSNGFIVSRAEDGLECLEMFKNSEPGYYDIILMDIRMPRMDGYQSVTAIRALSRSDAAVVPILAMTADAFNEDIQHCLEVGMNGHISKPLDFKVLLRLIKGYIKTQNSGSTDSLFTQQEAENDR